MDFILVELYVYIPQNTQKTHMYDKCILKKNPNPYILLIPFHLEYMEKQKCYKHLSTSGGCSGIK